MGRIFEAKGLSLLATVDVTLNAAGRAAAVKHEVFVALRGATGGVVNVYARAPGAAAFDPAPVWRIAVDDPSARSRTLFGRYAALRLEPVGLAGSAPYADLRIDIAGAEEVPLQLAAAIGDVTDITRDAAGNVTGYTEGGVVHVITRDAAGNVLSIAGVGRTETVTYDAAGAVAGVTTQ